MSAPSTPRDRRAPKPAVIARQISFSRSGLGPCAHRWASSHAGIARELERLHPMGLTAAGGPDPLHRRGRHPCAGRHRQTAPMHRPWGASQRQPDNLLDLPLRVDGLRPRPGRTLEKCSRPPSLTRSRQFDTVAGDTPTSLAVRVLANPSDAINNTRARCTSRCGAVCGRINFSSTERCSSATRSGGEGERIPHLTTNLNYLRDIALVPYAPDHSLVDYGARAVGRSRQATGGHAHLRSLPPTQIGNGVV